MRLPAGPWRVVLVNHPDHVRRVLRENQRNYRHSRFYERLRPIFGDGLFTSEGERWSRQRRLLQPAFDRKRIALLAPLMTETAERRLERWRPVALRGATLDVAEEMASLTFEIAARALLGFDPAGRSKEMSRAIPFVLETGARRASSLTRLGERLPTRRNLRFRQALGALDDLVRTVIEERRRGGGGRRDLLSLLLEAREREGGSAIDEAELFDQVKTMLVAGYVTTGNLLAWTWVLLARHPEAEARLRREIAAVTGGRTPAAEDVDDLAYTRRVIDEALRLFPPTWRLAREAIGDDEIGGYSLPSGSTVVFSPYLLHRHPAFWEAPEAFDPERFLPERARGRHPFAYLPFGGGLHVCIGKPFALLEARLVVAMIAQRYRLRFAPAGEVEAEPMATLRPRGGLAMTVEEVPAPGRGPGPSAAAEKREGPRASSSPRG